MASSPLRFPPAPKRHRRDLGSAAKALTSTPAPTGELAAAISLSPDMILEILSWLPLKSLCRSRCVSQEWRALISNPAFAAAHRSRAEPLLVARPILSTRGKRPLHLMDMEGTVVRVVEDPGASWTFRASFGDHVCFSSGNFNSCTLVVDLATGKTLLASLEAISAIAPMYYSGFGFGRAAQSGSLKVLRLSLRRSGEQICEVLAVGDGPKWRQVPSSPAVISLSHRCWPGVAVNGALHFLPEGGHDGVLSFDLDNDKWKVIHGPLRQGVIVGNEEVISIAELNGTLCMAYRSEHAINIWLLSDFHNNIWIKAYTMPMDSVISYVVPLRVLRLGGELLFYCYTIVTPKPVLQVYNPRLGRCTDVKTPINLVGEIGLCSSNLIPRFCGLP